MERDLALAAVRLVSTRGERLRPSAPTHIGVPKRVTGTARRPTVDSAFPHGSVVPIGDGSTVTVRRDSGDSLGYVGRTCAVRGDTVAGRWLVIGHVRYRHGDGHVYAVVNLDTGRTITVPLSRTDLRRTR
jgi:hypothetical protein